MSRFTADPRLTMGAKTIKLDDTFEFGCMACGKCCTEDKNSGIFLTGADIIRMARYLNLTCSEVIDKKLQVEYDPNVGQYVCVIQYRAYDHVCCFNRKSKCTIHPARPTSCALFPLGKSTRFGFAGNKPVILEPEYTFAVQHTRCSTIKEPHTVRDWLTLNGVQQHDLEEEAWYKCFWWASNMILKEQISDKCVVKRIFSIMYREYDLQSSDLVGQINAKTDEVKRVLAAYCDYKTSV